MSIMSVAEQRRHLKALGLPNLTSAQRAASWRVYQTASTWSINALYPDGVPGPLTSADVRVAAANGYRVSAHFALREFACTCGVARVDRALVVLLEKVRAKLYPSGLAIVSGYRCAKHNKAVGGIPTSSHLSGLAADIPAHATPAKFKGLGAHGIGYKARHGLVTHLDLAGNLGRDYIFIDK